MGHKARLRNLRRIALERMKRDPPMRLVPSKKGLATAFAVCCALGWVTGGILFWMVHR